MNLNLRRVSLIVAILLITLLSTLALADAYSLGGIVGNNQGLIPDYTTDYSIVPSFASLMNYGISSSLYFDLPVNLRYDSYPFGMSGNSTSQSDSYFYSSPQIIYKSGNFSLVGNLDYEKDTYNYQGNGNEEFKYISANVEPTFKLGNFAFGLGGYVKSQMSDAPLYAEGSVNGAARFGKMTMGVKVSDDIYNGHDSDILGNPEIYFLGNMEIDQNSGIRMYGDYLKNYYYQGNNQYDFGMSYFGKNSADMIGAAVEGGVDSNSDGNNYWYASLTPFYKRQIGSMVFSISLPLSVDANSDWNSYHDVYFSPDFGFGYKIGNGTLNLNYINGSLYRRNSGYEVNWGNVAVSYEGNF